MFVTNPNTDLLRIKNVSIVLNFNKNHSPYDKFE